VARPPIPPAPPAIAAMKAVGATTAFKRLFVTGMLFSVGLFVAFGFIVDFATDDGVSSSRAALLVGIVGASSIVGRLGLTALSARTSPVRLMQICLAAQPIAFAVWLVADDSYPLLIVFAVALGIAYGGYVALGPEVAAFLFGVVGLGSTMGLMFLGAGLGGFVGPPLAGWLADSTDGSTVPISMALGVSAIAFVIALAVPTRPESHTPVFDETVTT
jgi:MFS family permease